MHLVHFAGCTFYGNRASRGAAFYSERGGLAIRNSQFVGNSAASTGGSLYATAASLDINNTSFQKNTAGKLRNLSFAQIYMLRLYP